MLVVCITLRDMEIEVAIKFLMYFYVHMYDLQHPKPFSKIQHVPK
jgi:hypothetical protein